jgi:hypothetical protein
MSLSSDRSGVSDMDALQAKFAEEHRKFLEVTHPRLYRSLKQSGKLQQRLTSVGEEAADMHTNEMFRKLDSLKDVDPLEMEKQLRAHHEMMTELVRHDLIWQPIPQLLDEKRPEKRQGALRARRLRRCPPMRSR